MLTDVSTTRAEAIIRVKDCKSVTSLYTANQAAVTYLSKSVGVFVGKVLYAL